jgi:hypothetical protein
MIAPLRRVRRARFRVQREEHANHARTLLEDALRTASLGDEGRVVVVRSLHLGKLPLRAGATTWSLRLEQRMRQIHEEAVDADSPAAAQAGAVYFPGRLEPWLRLAVRTAQGRPCSEWYWERAAPGWTPQMSVPETLRHAFFQLATAGGLAATVALARRLPRRLAFQKLLDALHPADVASLFPAAPAGGVASETAPSTVEPDAFLAFDATVIARLRWLRTAAAAWPLHDPRRWWVAMVAVAEIRPEAPLVTLAEARALARRLELPQPPAPSDPESAATAPAPGQAMDSAVAEPEPDQPALPPSVYPDREPTRAGGLFFVLPLLARAGIAEWLVHHPTAASAGLPWQILRLALRHARTAEDDPLVTRLPVPEPSLPPGLAWRQLLAAHRSSRRLTNLPLRALIVRPALVAINETHIDVFFRSTEADVRIRRAGLDLDPGWVPWLRRVVSFHFNRED